MARTHEKVRYTPKSKPEKLTPVTAAQGVENALKILEGRWKLVILFHLFGGKVLRFSHLERAIRRFLKKMLIPATRRMETDGVIQRILHLKFHRKSNTALRRGAETVPALDALLKWLRCATKCLMTGAPVSLQEYAFSASRLLSVGVGDLAAKLGPSHVHGPYTSPALVAHYP